MLETSLLIVNTDAAMSEALRDYLSKDRFFRVLGVADTGTKAFSIIQTEQPDMVLMDLLLPEMDGLCLLKRMQSLKKPPIAICLSEFYSSLCVDAARRSGASYYIFKPASLESIASVLREYAALTREAARRSQFAQQAHEEDEYILRIHRELNELGFSPKYVGSGYLAECIALALKSPMLMQNLSGGGYRELSVRNNVSPKSIERNLRTAIAATDADGRLTEQFGRTPTNRECIQFILRRVNFLP